MSYHKHMVSINHMEKKINNTSRFPTDTSFTPSLPPRKLLDFQQQRLKYS